MGRLVFWAVKTIFHGNGIADFTSTWMDKIFEALYTIFVENGVVSDAINIFGAIAAAIAVLSILAETALSISRELMSFDRLIRIIIKGFIMAVFLMCMSDIIRGSFLIGYNTYYAIKDNNIFNISVTKQTQTDSSAASAAAEAYASVTDGASVYSDTYIQQQVQDALDTAQSVFNQTLQEYLDTGILNTQTANSVDDETRQIVESYSNNYQNTLESVARENGVTEESIGSADNFVYNFAGLQWRDSVMDDITLTTAVSEENGIECTLDPCGLNEVTSLESKKVAQINANLQSMTDEELDAWLQENNINYTAEEYRQAVQLASSEYSSTVVTQGLINGTLSVEENNVSISAYSSTFSTVLDAFQNHYGRPTHFIININVFVIIIPAFIICIIRIYIALMATSNAITIIVKIIMAPVAIVRLFDDGGMRSAGLRYIRSLAADSMVFAVILAMVSVGSLLSKGMLVNEVLSNVGYVVSCNTIGNLLSPEAFFIIILPELGVLGGIMGAKKIAGPICGVFQ